MFNPWFYMQVFVYLCSIKMYIYAICYGRQKTLWDFRVFLHVCKTSYLITFRFFVRFMFGENSRKRKQKREKPHFCRFYPKTSLFVANKVLIFSGLQVYRANYTPPPQFLALAGWVSSRPKFFIFLFLFFVKYSDFINSAFLLNFEHF